MRKVFLFLSFLLVACTHANAAPICVPGCVTKVPTRTPITTPTPIPTTVIPPTLTPTLTPTRTRTPTPSRTPTRTLTPTGTLPPTLTPSRTPTVTNTPTNTPTATNTPTPTQTSTPGATVQPVPSLSTFETNMNTFGVNNCTRLQADSGFDQYGQPNGLDDTYYDAEWVFFQIGDYQHNPAQWLPCAQAAHRIYGHGYIEPNAGGLPGYWLFPHGLAENWKRVTPQDPVSAKNLYDYIKANGAFVNSSPFNDNYQCGSGAWYGIRESAYAMMVQLKSTDFSESLNSARIAQLEGCILTAMTQTWVTKTATYRKPFMTALASQALITYYNQVSPDPAILASIRTAADYMWAHLWVSSPVTYPNHPSFMYTDDPRPTNPPGVTCTGDINDPCGQGEFETPDLNLLIVPMYYWLYSQTRAPQYLTEGDEIWASGVGLGLNLNHGKQFDQNYRWSIQGLKWRNGQ